LPSGACTMYSKPEITIPTATFKRIEDTMRKSPALMETAMKRAAGKLATEFRQTMATEPPPVPTYQRTHRLSRGWKTKLTVTKANGLFQYFNNVPYKKYVQGAQARPFHILRGWAQESVVVPDTRRRANQILKETWKTVSSPTAGVRP
jgi:hypothetical protein